MRKSVIMILVILAIICLSCTRKSGEMTILTENYPPLSYEENGVVTGYGADVVAALQQELNTDITPTLLPWDKAYTRALNEPNVVLFTIEKTPEREAKFNFIGPLGANTAYFYALAENPLELADLDAASRVKAIATTTNWFTEQYLVAQGFNNLISKTDPIDNLKMLVSTEADLGVFTDLTFPQICKEAGIAPETLKPVLHLMQSEYYIAISKATDPKIVRLWEAAFAKLQADGTLANLKGKWFPISD
jgi:polar amino acid transport system substrate-binding protein